MRTPISHTPYAAHGEGLGGRTPRSRHAVNQANPVNPVNPSDSARPPLLAPARVHLPTRPVPVVAPAHMLPVEVVGRALIAPDVVSIFLVLPGTRQAPAPYLPGQFVTLALPTPHDTLHRSYSLCGAGRHDQPWELTIKRVDEGAVSSYFYQSVRVGTLLYASLPRGAFTLPARLDPDMPINFVAVGSGIAPIMGMIRALDALPPEARPLAQLFYAARSPEQQIFGDALDDLDPDETWLCQWHAFSSAGDHLTPTGVLERAGEHPERARWYICGPEILKRDLQAELVDAGTPLDRIHAEIFATDSGPAYRVPAMASGEPGATVRVAETGEDLGARPGETLLATLERHGYRPPVNCGVGACGSCKLRLLSGRAEPAGEALTAREREAGYVLACVAQPVGDVTIASGGEPPRDGVTAGVRSGPTRLARWRVRLAALVAMAALVVGCWTLTDHPPAGVPGSPPPAAVPAAATPRGATPHAGTTHPAVSPVATHVATHTAKPAATRAPTPAHNPAHPKPAATATPMSR